MLWLAFFWTFLLIGFPAQTAKGWLAERLGQGFDANVSIEELHITWNLALRLTGVSIARQASESGPPPAGPRSGEGLTIRLDSLQIEPRLAGLVPVKPEVGFRGSTPSGGSLSGSYKSGEVTLSFKDISFNDAKIGTPPLPSGATMSGAGRLKVVAGKGTIDTEVDGVPGGKQRLRMLGGEGPGLDGKLRITISLPKL